MTSLLLFNFFLTQLLIVKLVSYDLTQWVVKDGFFPKADERSIVTFDNITRNIWILGGYYNRDQIFTFSVDTETLSNVTSIYNPNGMDIGYNEHSQSAVVIERTIYFMYWNVLKSLNIETGEYINDLGIISYDLYMCLVTDDDESTLYGAAGGNNNNFAFYDLVSKQSSKGPNTQHNHWGGICHVYKNILYVMSGGNSQIIEYIDLNEVNNNLPNAEWHTIAATIPKKLYAPFSAIWNDIIFIMGGRNSENYDTNNIKDTVYSFNTETTNISEEEYVLPFPMYLGPAICVHNRVYLIMGWNASYDPTDILLYADIDITFALSTEAPSVMLSKQPSVSSTLTTADDEVYVRSSTSFFDTLHLRDLAVMLIVIGIVIVCCICIGWIIACICCGLNMRSKNTVPASAPAIPDIMNHESIQLPELQPQAILVNEGKPDENMTNEALQLKSVDDGSIHGQIVCTDH